MGKQTAQAFRSQQLSAQSAAPEPDEEFDMLAEPEPMKDAIEEKLEMEG